MTNPQHVVVVAAASSERHVTDLEGGQACLLPSDQSGDLKELKELKEFKACFHFLFRYVNTMNTVTNVGHVKGGGAGMVSFFKRARHSDC